MYIATYCSLVFVMHECWRVVCRTEGNFNFITNRYFVKIVSQIIYILDYFKKITLK